ncbi:tyrosine-type recombinase/integrase [Staphylococcus pseudintermedius]|uniref:site-specific integrase n=1 Tax=Staphylococcus pseudintermedius TaxID=283734 RepID=UPI0019FDC61B|nr:tyrosine-type recombinase/integrase [Staphylococcus pseudintermedius]EGQ4283847.1 site-specific integrase [Staphylococcus pseudintermedius]WMZ49721.1 tyrosine-type recombinase/integrase [Staphylococcus pseudintermedius]
MPVYKDDKTGKWYFSVRYKDVFGNNKRKMKRGFKTKRQAKVAEADFIQKTKNGYSDKQIYEVVFYEQLKNTDLRERTIRRKKYDYTNHIKEKFGNRKISEITRPQCLEFRTHLIDNCNSINTARTIWFTFKAVFSYASLYYGLSPNPCTGIPTIPKKKTKFNFVTKEEFHNKIVNLKNDTYREMLTFMFYTGTRVGEAMGMLWEDVNLERKEISISKTWDITQRKMADYPKTSSSIAILPTPKILVEMLSDMYEIASNKYYGFNDSMFVFGGYAPPDYAHFSRTVKTIFPKITSHGLRHSYASYLADKGCDIYVLRDLLRHSSITETVDTYTHFYNNKKHDVMSLFDD